MADHLICIPRQGVEERRRQLSFVCDGRAYPGAVIPSKEFKDFERDSFVVDDPFAHLGESGDDVEPNGHRRLFMACALVVLGRLTESEADEFFC